MGRDIKIIEHYAKTDYPTIKYKEALKAKGPAKRDATGWVVETNLELPLLERTSETSELASEAA